MNSPNKGTSKRYQRLKAKYHQLKKRLHHQLKNGTFYHFSKRKQQQLFQRLQHYFQRLQHLQKLATPAALLSTALLCQQPLEAQTFTEVTDTSSPFIFLDVNTNAPFGLEDIGNRAVPTFIDVDNDGDLDVFIGERDGNINYFENISTDNSIPVFSLISSDNAFGLGTGYYVAPIVVDIDGDEDFDMFVGTHNDGISFYRNTSNDSAVPAFSLSTESEPFGLTNIGVQLTPTFVDIDNDGDFDAFIGEESGDINFFENTGDSMNPNFVQSSESEPFGIAKVFRNSSPSFVDIDNDGDLDLFSGEGKNLTNQKIVFFENTSTNSSIPAFIQINDLTPFGINYSDYGAVPRFIDIDKDGDFDLFTGEGYGNTKFYKNTGNKNNPSFLPQSIDVGYYATPAFGDIDNDGDLDMFIGEENKMNFFENIGDNFDPIFSYLKNTAPFGLPILSNPTPVLIDIDNDGDLDLFSGRNGGRDNIQFFENTSTDNSIPAFMASTDNTPFGLTSDGVTSITFIDIDDDGDNDAFIGDSDDYPNLFFFENTSTNSSIPAFMRIPGGFVELGIFDDRPIPYFTDIDGDEDFDLFIGDSSGDIIFFENIGDKTNAIFSRSTDTSPFNLLIDGTNNAPAILDIDNDGFYETIIGERMGYLNYFESDISTSLANLEVTNFNNQNTQFCLNTSKIFTEVSLGNRGCDRNGNAIYTASVTPPNQGLTASVVGAGEIEGDCSFFIELNTSETAIAGNYSINLTIEDTDGVGNSSSTPDITNTGTVIVFNLGIVEVLNLEEVEVEPILGTTIENGTSEDFMVNINNTTPTTTYEWMVAGVALPIMTGDDVDTGAAISIDLGDGNTINVNASTESVVGDFTQSILTIENPTGGAAQDFEASLTATQDCGSDTQAAIFTSGNFNCSDEDIVLSNRFLPTDNYEAFNTLTSQSIIPPDNGVAFVAGEEVKLLPNFHAQNGSTFVAKIEDCTAEIATIEKRSIEKASSFLDLKLLPNPANGESSLQFYLSKATELSLEVYDARGTLIQQVWNGQTLESGQQQITLHLANNDSGMYFITLRSKEDIWIEKLIVLE